MNFIKCLRKYKLNSLFIKIISWMFLLMLISNMIIWLFSYKRSYDRLKTEIYKTNYEIMNRVQTIFDIIMSNSVMQLLSLGTDNETVEMLIKYYEYGQFERYKKIERISLEMDEILNNYKYIHSIYLYIEDYHKIISAQEIKDERLFHDMDWFNTYTNMKQEKEYQTMEIKKIQRSFEDSYGNKKEVITLIGLVPFNKQKKNGCIIINIDKYEMMKFINENKIDLINDIIVLDQNDYPIIATSNGLSLFEMYSKNNSDIFEVGNTSFLVILLQSKYNNWKYVSFSSIDRLDKYIYPFTKAMFFMLFVSVFIVLLIAYCISLKVYRPFFNIYQQFDSERELKYRAADEISFISNNIRDIIRQNKSLDNIMKDNYSIIRNSFLVNAVKGNLYYSSEGMLLEKIKFYELNIKIEQPIVLIFVNIKNDVAEVSKSIIASYEVNMLRLIEMFKKLCYRGDVFEFDNNNIGIIMNVENKENIRDEIIKICTTLFEHISNIFGYESIFAVSDICKDYKKLEIPYKQVMTILKYSFALENGSINFYSDMKLNTAYNNDILANYKEKITYYMRNANSEQMEEAFDSLLSYMMKCNMTKKQIKFIIIQLIGYIELELYEINLYSDEIADEIRTVYEMFNQDKNFIYVKKALLIIYKKVCFLIESQKKEKMEKRIRKALEYIENNYYRDISLNDVSEYLKISAPYLSQQFNEYMGVTFKEYISKLRVEKAIELLKNSDINMEQIYQQVGFNNISTFYRVFKKYTKKTPGAYRNKNLTETT